MNAIELTAVSKSFEAVTAVDNVSLDVPAGSVYGLIGPNGSGKTTTMRMIAGILGADSGSIRVFGAEVLTPASELVGYLPEERGLYRKMQVRAFLEFYGELKCGRRVGRQVGEWLERFGLQDWGSRKIETLSKGMSQKVQFIAAVVPEPKVLILDEPFSGLDPVSAGDLRQAVLEMRRRGVTIMLSTHDMAVAEAMCDSICMIFRGRKVLDGTLSAIQTDFGEDTIRVSTADGRAVLDGLAGIHALADFGQYQELRIAAGADSQAILHELLARTRVKSFAVTRPSLHDIFVRIARPEKTEETSRA